MKHRHLLHTSLALALACAAAVHADDGARNTRADPAASTVQATGTAGFNRMLATANQHQARDRAAYPAMFAAAYARYPALPKGVLESIAYAETGWVHVRPDPRETAAHRHMPAAYGIMGLYRGQGFSNQVADAARLLSVPESLIVNDPETNILAAAALLDRAMRTSTQRRITATATGSEAGLADALARYAGYGNGDSNISSFARQSFAFNALQTMQRGVDEQGIKVPGRSVSMEGAFAPDTLRKLRAPALVAVESEDRIDIADARSNRAATLAAGDYPGAIWNPAHPANYSTAANSTSAVILHTVEGSYAGGISWFQNPQADVSAHYVIRRSDGQVTQMVREGHQAWHASNHNGYTIGIEHEGYSASSDNWTPALVNASAALTRSICQRRGVNCASAWQGPGYDHWNVVPDSVRVKGHGMLTNNQSRYDPGKYFPWATYYGLINGGAAGGGGTGSGSVLEHAALASGWQTGNTGVGLSNAWISAVSVNQNQPRIIANAGGRILHVVPMNGWKLMDSGVRVSPGASISAVYMGSGQPQVMANDNGRLLQIAAMSNGWVGMDTGVRLSPGARISAVRVMRQGWPQVMVNDSGHILQVAVVNNTWTKMDTGVRIAAGASIAALAPQGQGWPQLVANDGGAIVQIAALNGWRRLDTGVRTSADAAITATLRNGAGWPDIFSNENGVLMHIGVGNGKWVKMMSSQRPKAGSPISAALSGAEGSNGRANLVYSLY